MRRALSTTLSNTTKFVNAFIGGNRISKCDVECSAHVHELCSYFNADCNLNVTRNFLRSP